MITILKKKIAYKYIEDMIKADGTIIDAMGDTYSSECWSRVDFLRDRSG